MSASPPLFSIVIPTRERVDTLRHAVQTVLTQTAPNWELIVMDNASSDGTPSFLGELKDPRIRTARSEERLPMSANWEKGLSLTKGDYVFVLGDDDGLMPDAIELATRLTSQFPETPISSQPAKWYWPDVINPAWRGITEVTLSNCYVLVDSRHALRQLMSFTWHYHSLPGIYQTFVPRKIIAAQMAKAGRFFSHDIPDAHSAVVVAKHSKNYVFSYRPLSVYGLSRHSTGISQSFPHLNDSALQTFRLEIGHQPGIFDRKRFPGAEILIEALIAQCLIDCWQETLEADPACAVDNLGLIRSLIPAVYRFPDQYAEIKSLILAMGAAQGIPASKLEFPPREYTLQQSHIHSSILDAPPRTLLSFSLPERAASNIAEAAWFLKNMVGDFYFYGRLPNN